MQRIRRKNEIFAYLWQIKNVFFAQTKATQFNLWITNCWHWFGVSRLASGGMLPIILNWLQHSAFIVWLNVRLPDCSLVHCFLNFSSWCDFCVCALFSSSSGFAFPSTFHLSDTCLLLAYGIDFKWSLFSLCCCAWKTSYKLFPRSENTKVR